MKVYGVLISLFVIQLCIVNIFSSISKSSPIFLWSNTGYFTGVNTESVDVVDALYFQNIFQHKDASFINQNSTNPEVLIVFVGSSLTTDKIGVLSNAYSAQSNGGSISNLKTFIQDSKSSAVFPYVINCEFQSFVSYFISSFPQTSSIVVVTEDGKSISDISGAQAFFSINTLMEKIQSNQWKVLNNGVTDLVIVSLTSPIQENDVSVGNLINALGGKTTYVAMFTGVQHTEYNTVSRSFPVSHLLLDKFETTFQQTNLSNWPGGVIEALLVMTPFLFILGVGICCTFGLQSNLKFDAEKSYLKNRSQ